MSLHEVYPHVDGDPVCAYCGCAMSVNTEGTTRFYQCRSCGGTETKKFAEKDLPHSDVGHNPYWCGGDMDGGCCGDDPCWSCVRFLHEKAMAAQSELSSLRAENERLREQLESRNRLLDKFNAVIEKNALSSKSLGEESLALGAIPHERDLIREIAMDIGKQQPTLTEWDFDIPKDNRFHDPFRWQDQQVAWHIESMYPEAVKAASSTFLLSVRNCVHNEIIGAIESEIDAERRIAFNDKFRRYLRKLYKQGEARKGS